MFALSRVKPTLSNDTSVPITIANGFLGELRAVKVAEKRFGERFPTILRFCARVSNGLFVWIVLFYRQAQSVVEQNDNQELGRQVGEDDQVLALPSFFGRQQHGCGYP